MKTRRNVSLLLLISFALSAATGVLFSPAMRFLIGISNEGMWRMVHFYVTNAMLILIVIHLIINRKALGSYLHSARIGSITAYSLAVIIFLGIIFYGLNGSELSFKSVFYEEDIHRMRSLPEPTLVSFPEDFKDGKVDGWNLGPGWEVKLEDGNHVLGCFGEKWSGAIPTVNG